MITTGRLISQERIERFEDYKSARGRRGILISQERIERKNSRPRKRRSWPPDLARENWKITQKSRLRLSLLASWSRKRELKGRDMLFLVSIYRNWSRKRELKVLTTNTFSLSRISTDLARENWKVAREKPENRVHQRLISQERIESSKGKDYPFQKNTDWSRKRELKGYFYSTITASSTFWSRKRELKVAWVATFGAPASGTDLARENWKGSYCRLSQAPTHTTWSRKRELKVRFIFRQR